MTPAARVQAAIEILDRIVDGHPAEQALTNWARGHRFAGSGDRAAIRDHVFDALRCWRSYSALGGGESGRALMIGTMRAVSAPLEKIFGAGKYCPAPLSMEEQEAGLNWDQLSQNAQLDCPDWLAPSLQAALGDGFAQNLTLLRQRAPVFLRVNTKVNSVVQAIDKLEIDRIIAVPHALASTALVVTEGARRIRQSIAYREGCVELQDGASQALVEALPSQKKGAKILDFCAGGGGKTLAMTARFDGEFYVHDSDPRRMKDIPERARRAGIAPPKVFSPASGTHAKFDLVLCDVPCSGSGAWRRQPEAKWRLTPERLDEILEMQAEILNQASDFVNENGVLAYATCSLLDEENSDQIESFLQRQPNWTCERQHRWTPEQGGDGFGLAILWRVNVV